MWNCLSTTSPWACTSLVLLKSRPAIFRFTVDLQRIPRYTVNLQYLIPIIEHHLDKICRSHHFSDQDLSHGNWLFPSKASSQACQSFSTLNSIFSSTRILDSMINAAPYLQLTIYSTLSDRLETSLLQ